MKAKWKLFIAILLGALIGWALGFLRFPYLENNQSFLLGFIACLSCGSLVLLLLFAWNKKTFLLRIIGKDPTANVSINTTRTSALTWILVSASIVVGSLVCIVIIYCQKESFNKQSQNQNKKIHELSQLIESVKQSNQGCLMSSTLDKVEKELKENPYGMLSDTTIASIAALNFSFKPYSYFEGDSLSNKKLSPERGQLLLALSLMKIDSSSFTKLKHEVPFSEVDLRNADLKGVDLSGADLSDADFKDADLSGANLSKANLRSVVLKGANLTRANLSGADLKRADLSWAVLNEANLKLADMNGVNLSNAQLRKADLSGATIQFADLNGAMFNETNFTGVDFLGTSLVKANLSGANLNGTDLRRINLSEANLDGTELNRAIVDENWLEKLNEWRLTGVQQVQKNYIMVNDSTDKWKKAIYRLRKNKDEKPENDKAH